MRANTILDTIGRTPHVRFQRLFGSDHEVWVKLERANPGASIKDRIALSMIEDAEKKGTLKKDLLDGVIQVEHTDAYEMARRAAKEEGLFVGVSSGASLAAVKQKLAELPKGARVLTFSYDTGERYLSVDGLWP